MDASKLKYILPNMLTLTSVFCGMVSIQMAMTTDGAQGLATAAWLIVAAMICDLFDGRVARMTRAQSEFGVQLDSLADAVSFGVAPGILLYRWGLEPLGIGGQFIGFVFAACAIVRLARFNVQAAADGGSSRFFTGLPTPLAAGTVVSIVLAHISVTGTMTTGAYLNAAALTVLLAGLMVSNVRYRTFKDINLKGPALGVLVMLLLATVGVAITFKPAVAFVMVMVLYIGLGLGGGMVRLGKNILVGHDEADYGDDYDEAFVEARDDER